VGGWALRGWEFEGRLGKEDNVGLKEGVIKGLAAGWGGDCWLLAAGWGGGAGEGAGGGCGGEVGERVGNWSWFEGGKWIAL